MTIGSPGLKAVAGLALAAIVFAGLASCSAAVLPDGAREVPDLMVSSPSASTGAPAAGTTFTLSVAVRNQGEGAAAATLRYYRSTDATITSSDTEVGKDTVVQLAGSGSSSQSVELTAPASPGAYYYGACVDPVTDESDTTNNCSTSVPVTVPETETETEPQPEPEPEPEPDPERYPDLVVSSPSVSDSGPAGGAQFTLSATVRNAGEGAAAATMLRYYRSTDAAVTTTDTEVGTDAIAELAAAGSSSKSVDLTAPASPGTYYYGACVNPVTDESDTANNCSDSVPVTVPEPERPDLVVTSPRVSDSGPAAGAQFTLSATVRNAGEGSAAATTLRYHQSTDATITTTDTALETVAIAGLAAAGSSSQLVDLTAPSSPGTYYYGACVDAVADESDTTNNCSLSVQVTVQVTVTPPTPPRGNPDLIVTSVEVSDSGLEAEATFTLSAVVENAGEGKSEATALRYYRSTDTAITATDTWVGTVTIAGLAGSGSSSRSVELTAPSSPGRYYYGACVDAVPGESDTTNNCSRARTVRVVEGPDLVVGGPFVSNGTPEAGGTFLLVVSVRNRGDATSAATTVRHYRSTDATVTNADTLEGTEEVRPLVSLQSFGKQIDLTAPLTPGTYYYGSCVDPVPGESDTTNNCSESREVTAREPEPDQVVQSVEVAPREVTLSALGDTTALTARVLDAQDNEIFGEAVSWSSNFPEVATVDAAGTVTAVAEGVAMVTASASGVSGGATVTVFQRAASAAIDPGEVELTSVDETASLTLRAFDANGHEAPGGGDITSWSWRSANLKVAIVSSLFGEAEVRAVGTGMTDVTATVVTENGVSLNAKTKVTVTIAQYPDLEVETTVSDETPETGASFTLSATVSNAGDGESPATTLTYYQSTDATITTSDASVGTDDVGVLSASGTSEESISLTAPESPATYYYGACVDAVTDESDTTNNCSGSVPVTVPEPDQRAPNVEISAEDDKEWAPVGDTVDLSARVLDDEGEEVTGTTVRWSSSNTAVATVDSSGVMTAVGEGTVTLTATATAPSSATQSSAKVSDAARSRESGGAVAKREGTVSASIRMTCVPRAARIEITPDSVSLDEVGATARLTATVYDADDNEIQPTHWRWSSADREVATVAGLAGVPLGADVTAVGAGTTTVTLRANGSATGTATVAVTLPRGRVAVWPRSLTFDAFGQTRSLTVRVLDGNGDEDEDASFSYRVSSGSTPRTLYLEKLDDGLQITAQGTVRGSITITSPGVESATVPVTVFQEPAALVVAPDSVSLTVGDTATLSARVMDANGHDIQLAGSGQRGRVVYWTTDDEEVATVAGEEVDRPGNRGGTATVSAAAAGTATITGTTMTLDGTGLVYVIGEATVTVTEPPAQD